MKTFLQKIIGTLVCVFTLLATTVHAQINISPPQNGNDYTALIQNFFVGQGVTISNVQYTGAPQASGSFENVNTNFPLTGGIILTTGQRNNALGPNNVPNASANINSPGIPELTAQAGVPTFDGTTLEFDFVAQSNSVSFKYVFASEEYPEFVGSNFNDVFAFFISGPGIVGNQNIALIPATSTPIAINNVNGILNNQYYVDNTGGQAVEYDGYTVALTATSAIQACQTYHLKICIADAGDDAFDSAVMLEQNSLTSQAVTVQASSGYQNSANGAFEGCLPGFLNFSVPAVMANDFTFNYQISGSAINGVDYQTIPNQVTIPAGQTTAQVTINAIEDNQAEGVETIIVTVVNACNTSTTTVDINDVAPLAVAIAGATPVCGSNQQVNLSANATGGLPPYTYTWTANNANIGNTQNITTNPTQTTTYSVLAEGACPNQQATTAASVTVFPIPTADFTLSSASVCDGQQVSATYTGNASFNANYNWSVNNGATLLGGGQDGITVIYPTPNTYTISLSVTENGCTSLTTQTAQAVVNPVPSATFTMPSTICAGSNGTITYTGTQIPGATYNWNFGNAVAVSGSGAGPYQVNFPNFGNNSVVLEVLANGCYSGTNGEGITIFEVPTSSFAISSNSVCDGQPVGVTYTGNATGGATYNWAVNNGATMLGNGQNPIGINYTVPNTYTVSLSVTENGCTSLNTQTATVVVNPQPTATFTMPSNLCANANGTITYTGTQIPNATYNWNFGGANVVSGSGAGPYQVNWANQGLNTVSLQVSANGCNSPTNNQNVNVFTVPTSAFTLSSNAVCDGQPVGVTYTGNATGGATYNWAVNNGATMLGNGQNPIGINYTVPNTYTVSLSVTENGCTSLTTQTAQAVVNPQPVATFTLPTSLCANANGTITYTGTQIPNATYNWNFDGAAVVSGSGAGPYQVSWPNEATNSVTLQVIANGCSTAVVSQNINVILVPTATFSLNSAAVCNGQPITTNYTGNADVGATYNWTVNNGATIVGNGQGPVGINYPATGTYTVSLIVSQGGCTSPAPVTNQVIVHAIPTATFTLTNAVCDGSPAVATYTGTANPANAQFNWGWNGGTATAQGIEVYDVVYPADGNYTASLSVTENGCTSTLVTDNIIVHPIPTATFTAVSPICLNGVSGVAYTGTASPGANYNWTFDGGTPSNNTQNFNVSWLTAGTKNIGLTVSENGCTGAPVNVPVIVNANPIANFSFDDITLCMGQSGDITFTGVADPLATYNWTVTNGGTIIANGNNSFTLAYPGVGDYAVSLQVVQNGCLSLENATGNATVFQMPTSAYISSGSPTCTGTNVQLSYTGNASANAVYQWTANNGATVTGTHPNYDFNYPSAGTYAVALVVTEDGCTSTLTNQTIVVNQTPTAAFISSGSPVCNGTPVTFTYQGNASPNANYAWNVTNGATVDFNGNNQFNLNYPGPGMYVIKLMVEENGCPAFMEEEDTVIVNEVPVSTFAFANSPVCDGLPVELAYTGNTIPGALYSWFLPDSVSLEESGLTTYNVVYPGDGTYVIGLKVTANGCSSDTTNVPIVILPKPFAAIAMGAQVCENAPATISFGGTLHPNNTYTWNFDGGTVLSGTGAGPYQVEWANAGQPQVTLTFTDSLGCTSLQNVVPITVNPIPQAIFDVTTPLCTNQNGAVYYNGVQLPGASYTWNFNGGIVGSGTSVGPYQISWATPGTKQVTLTVVANGCQSEQGVQLVTVNPTPTANFVIGDTIVCAGEQVQILYNGNASINANYNWLVTNGGSVSGTGPFTLDYTNEGSYTVNLQVTENGCMSDMSATATVQVLPKANAYFAAPIGQCFSVHNYALQAQGQFTAQDSLLWIFGIAANTLVSGSTNPSNIIFNAPGAYPVSLTITNAGCSDTYVDTLHVYPDPVLNITVTQLRGCVPLEVTFANNPALTGNPTYTWDFGNGETSTLATPTHIYTESGTYTPQLNVSYSAACFADIAAQGLINVYPQPTAGFSLTPTETDIFTPIVEITDNSVGATAIYYFMGNADTIANTQNFEYSYTNPGVYTIVQYVTNAYGCIDTAQNYVVIKDNPTLFVPNAFSPNNDGTNDYFGAKGAGISQFTMVIFNRWGEVVFVTNDINNLWDGNDKSGETSPTGVYVYKLFYTLSNGTEAERIGSVALVD